MAKTAVKLKLSHYLLALTIVFFMAPVSTTRSLDRAKHWPCWEYSGKGRSTKEITGARPLTYFTEHLADFDAEIKWRATNEQDHGWAKIHAQIKPVGTMSGQKILDVFYFLSGNTRAFGKLILIGNAKFYRPVVWILDDSGIDLAPSEIKVVQGMPILSSRCRVSGTGNDYIEDYVSFDPGTGSPTNLARDVDAVVAAAEKRLIPPGHDTRKGGGFDLGSLAYTNHVWKPGDPECCPTGGRITIAFKLMRRRIVESKADYEP